MEVLTTWRDKEDSEANMATLEKALQEIGRENIADDFKKLAYSSYSKDPVVAVETHHVSSSPQKSSTPTDSSPGHRHISEFLDSAGEMDAMFTMEDDVGSPRSPRLSDRDEEVFNDEGKNSPEPIEEESVIPVEKQRVVDEDGNEISKEDTEKLLQDFFSNDKGVLDFLSDDPTQTGVENGGETEETEI